MLNDDVASLFDELAELTKLEDQSPQSFRARAYESAARAVRGLSEQVDGLSKPELVAEKGIGGSSADKILEFVADGRIDKLERLRAEYPPEYREMVRIPGIGAKTAAKLRAADIADVAALRDAIAEERLRELPGLGAKSEEKIATAIERLGMTGKDRRAPIVEALPVAERIAAELAALEGVDRTMVCGSVRRMRETIGDVDILVAAADPTRVAEHVPELSVVREVLGAGTTKVSFLTHSGLQVDVRVVQPDQFGAAVLYFTGSKAHNIALRSIALASDQLLNEYGLSADDTVLASRTEADIYAALGLAFIPAPMREDTGEVDLAKQGPVRVLEVADLRGDLHVHTDLSGDGEDSLEEMVAAAATRGYEFVAITDHAEDLAINGASRDEMLDQRAEIARLQASYPDLAIFHGAELNIGPTGTVDYDAEFLAGYDLTVASVHSHFDLSAEDQTVRLITAMSNPYVDVIGHLTGRMIGRRPGIDLDIDAVLEAAALTGVALEINSSLSRLDAPAEVIRKARGTGVLFTIDTDAHRVSELDWTRHGVAYAVRGWLDPDQCLNTWPEARFREHLARRRRA